MAKTPASLALALLLSACAAVPPAPRPLVQTQPAAAGPKAAPQRNVTHFADGLRCMDDMLYRFGVRDVSVMIEEMQDQSRKLGAGTRDMMVSAFADMTRRSRGVRLVTFGQDNQNIVQLLSIAQRLNDFKVVRQYDWLLELRTLSAQELGERKSGLLTAGYYHVNENFKVGVGYNFTDFSDDLTDLSYRSRGVFVNMLGKF